MAPLSRLAGWAMAVALAIAAIGLGWEASRAGFSRDAAVGHLRRELREEVAAVSRRVQSLASRVAQDATLVNEAATTRERLPVLFARLMEHSGAADSSRVSVTVYVPSAGDYQVLAWSDGPAENVARDRLAGPAALFVAPGTAGLRLVYVQPIDVGGRRIGVAAAESVLSASGLGAASSIFTLPTSFGDVRVDRPFAGIEDTATRPNTFLIDAPDGGPPLLEVTFDPGEVDRRRVLSRARVLALAGIPLVLAVLLTVGRVLARRSTARTIPEWTRVTAAAVGVLLFGAVALLSLARVAQLPELVLDLVSALTALAISALVPVSLWWRRSPRRTPSAAITRFVVEHLLGGVVMAAAVVLLAQLFSARVDPRALAWQTPVLPFAIGGVVYFASAVLKQLAIVWTTAAVLGLCASRWRLGWNRLEWSLAAAALWLAPTLSILGVSRLTTAGSPMFAGALGALAALARAVPVGPALVLVGLLVVFSWASTDVRRFVRGATQAGRLLLLFVALLLPPLSLYPMSAQMNERTSRELVAGAYALQTARHPEDLQGQLALAQAEIDRLPGLVQYVTTRGPVDRQRGGSILANAVWRETSLSKTRVTSDVELYGSDRSLVSRFALNLPEYVYPVLARPWQGTSCTWETFGEMITFGAQERPMLHAERGICDPATGLLLGGVVLHIAQSDYQALPFLPAANPYDAVLTTTVPTAADAGVGDLQVVVYGWSLQPLFVSGRVAWPISDATFERLYQSRTPFWTTLPADGRAYHVYLSQDRGHIYALGYPAPTGFQHATRLASIAALVAVMFVLLQAGALVYVPFARRAQAPLRVLFHEIRTSFYRKLFLFFVLAAVGPVLLFALAFGAYMTSKFRADVESEAKSAVNVARRVFEELSVASQAGDRQPAPANDDMMVWIRQVIDQDVNLFEKSELVATSQRDLFDSGLLPTRTPAAVYREVVLNRMPAYVVEDQLRTGQYLVAAAPVSVFGRDREAVLSLPLALRQSEIEREIDELRRGVLVGAVLVVLFAAGLGASIAGRIADPVARLTRATRLIAAGHLDARVATDTADELRRLVDDFNSMAETLAAQRAELARTNQLEAWNEMARQVAHEIKNPLTPIQLAAEHLQRVHDDRGRPLGDVVEQCVRMILGQVKLLRQIASEFANFAGTPAARLEPVSLREMLPSIANPYRIGLAARVVLVVDVPDDLPDVLADRTLLARALTNLAENAIQAMPDGGTLRLTAVTAAARVVVTVADTGVGMDAVALERAFEPYFSTKTGGSGLGLANAKRNIELCGGTVAITSRVGVGTTITVSLAVALTSPPATS